jgi:hypothetical protein
MTVMSYAVLHTAEIHSAITYCFSACDYTFTRYSVPHTALCTLLHAALQDFPWADPWVVLWVEECRQCDAGFHQAHPHARRHQRPSRRNHQPRCSPVGRLWYVWCERAALVWKIVAYNSV